MAKTGRPTKPAASGTRVSLGLKVTADLKHRMEEAARRSGRTQSQEAEYRLERSFDPYWQRLSDTSSLSDLRGEVARLQSIIAFSVLGDQRVGIQIGGTQQRPDNG